MDRAVVSSLAGRADASGSQTALYWYGFLRWLHSQQNAATGNSYVADDIIAYMSAAIGDHTNCLGIKFIAINGDDVRVTEAGLSAPTNANPNAYIQTILLQTVDHGTDFGVEPSSTGQDPPGEDVPDPSATARVKAGYRSNKKVAKKKAAKKKAPKKKAAKKKK